MAYTIIIASGAAIGKEILRIGLRAETEGGELQDEMARFAAGTARKEKGPKAEAQSGFLPEQ